MGKDAARDRGLFSPSLPCIAFYDDPVIYSRLFGTPIDDPATMREALTDYAATLARRLRRKRLHATVLTISASTLGIGRGRRDPEPFGRASIGYGRSGLKRLPSSTMYRRMLSLRYTTCWAQLPTAR